MATSSHHSFNRGSGKAFRLGYPSDGTDSVDYRKHHVGDVRQGRLDQTDAHGAVPTILVVGCQELVSAIVPLLKGDGYLVLAAQNEAEALHIVVTHSRSIHFLLADEDMNGNNLSKSLSAYRRQMRCLLMTRYPQHSSNALAPANAVAKVRQYLELPKGVAEKTELFGVTRPKAFAMTA